MSEKSGNHDSNTSHIARLHDELQRLENCVAELKSIVETRDHNLPTTSLVDAYAAYGRDSKRAPSPFLTNLLRGLDTSMSPDDSTTPVSRLHSSAVRIDHVAIAVRDLEQAVNVLTTGYGFTVSERRRVEGASSGMFSATLTAGSVTLVICQGDSETSNVSRYIEAFGPGVQHLAIEVTDQEGVVKDLHLRGADMLTDVIRGPGLLQAFTRREPATGMQFEFVSRLDNSGFDDANVNELFRAMEGDGAF